MAAISFIVFLVLFGIVGIWSARKTGEGDKDYLLADGTVSPFLTALSAAATKNSGYMFIGLMGYVFTYGLSGIWLVCGFLFGDLVAFSFVHKRLRAATEETGALSYAALLARWGGGNKRMLQLAVGTLTLVFLTVYAAAQFSAGGKALSVLFGWPSFAGAVIGAGLILVYCLTGGLRASIWTDAAQSLVMMGAMVMLLLASISGAGGVDGFTTQLEAVAPGYFDLGVERFGGMGALALFAFGWLFNGLGVTGQPQVMVRFMALDDTENTRKTGIYYFAWTGTFLLTTFVVGLATRLYIDGTGGFDAELALPTLAGQLMPGVAVGIILGGIFAATMSTTDSQILACSAVLSEDFKLKGWLGGKRLATFMITMLALLIALFASANVFTLVIFAWSALACGLGPIVIVHALGGRPTEGTCLAMMATGLVTALMWRELGLTAITYEGLPGMAAAFVVYGIGRVISR
ncbi:MAG: sodium/proline symporter [Alphaproteobacteria bacterium]|nr:sodium/proline symporter [Alphaproteobacteria bacterium]